MIEIDKNGNTVLSNGKVVNVKQYTDTYKKCVVLEYEQEENQYWVDVRLFFDKNLKYSTIDTYISCPKGIDGFVPDWGETMFSMFSDRGVILSAIENDSAISKDVFNKSIEYLNGIDKRKMALI